MTAQIPDNEFSGFSIENGDMASMDVMLHNYLKFYNRRNCPCGKEWWSKKDEIITSDLCVNCRREQMKAMNLENIL